MPIQVPAAQRIIVVDGRKTIRVSNLGQQGPQGEPGPPGVGLNNLDLLLWLADNGPFESHPTAYREVTGSPFPTLITWYTDSGKTEKIVDKAVTYNGNLTPNTITRRLYDPSDGVTVTLTAVDTIVYSGVFETSRTRVVT